MAYTATTVVEVRAGGSDTNGGGFQPGGGGTDYPAAGTVFALSGISVAGSTVSCGSRAFAAADVGNYLYTNDTLERTRIVSVDGGGTATVSPDLGGAADTAQLGGALGTLAGLATALSGAAAGVVVWVRGASGAFSLSTPVTLPSLASTARALIIRGYGTVRGDRGRPVFNVPAGVNVGLSQQMIDLSAGVTLMGIDLRASNDDPNQRHSGVRFNGANTECREVVVTGGFRGFLGGLNESKMVGCKNLNNSVLLNPINHMVRIFDHECAGGLIQIDSYAGAGGSVIEIDGLVMYPTSGNQSVGLTINFGPPRLTIRHSSIFGTTGNGISATAGAVVAASIIVGSSGAGISFAGADGTSTNNAFYNNTGGAITGTNVSLGDFTLTSDPFNASAQGDLRLNNVAGGGKELREWAYGGRVNPNSGNFGPNGQIGAIRIC